MDNEKYFNHLDHQDWKTITVNKTKDKNVSKPKQKITNNSKEKILEKKIDEDNLKHKKITPELKQKIIQSRCSQKLTQKQLAQKCNLPLQIINEIETGKAIYNHQHINKIKRILKIH